MGDATRRLDGGGPFIVEEHAQDPPPPCSNGVCVETQFDASADDDVTLSLRRTERHEGGPTYAYGEPVVAAVSLATGRCTQRDDAAQRMFVEHPWLRDALVQRLEWFRERARRAAAQRDRETSCFAALERAQLGAMISHDDLFPADWDLLFEHDGRSYWAVEYHCPNATCPCADIVVWIYNLETQRPQFVGELRVDRNARRRRPKTSSPRAATLFEPLWTRHGARLLERYDEVRRAVARHAARPAAADMKQSLKPARNAPCPCGSGKKYKRCCFDRDMTGSAPLPRAPRP